MTCCWAIQEKNCELEDSSLSSPLCQKKVDFTATAVKKIQLVDMEHKIILMFECFISFPLSMKKDEKAAVLDINVGNGKELDEELRSSAISQLWMFHDQISTWMALMDANPIMLTLIPSGYRSSPCRRNFWGMANTIRTHWSLKRAHYFFKKGMLKYFFIDGSK